MFELEKKGSVIIGRNKKRPFENEINWVSHTALYLRTEISAKNLSFISINKCLYLIWIKYVFKNSEINFTPSQLF